MPGTVVRSSVTEVGDTVVDKIADIFLATLGEEYEFQDFYVSNPMHRWAALFGDANEAMEAKHWTRRFHTALSLLELVATNQNWAKAYLAAIPAAAKLLVKEILTLIVEMGLGELPPPLRKRLKEWYEGTESSDLIELIFNACRRLMRKTQSKKLSSSAVMHCSRSTCS